MIWHGLVLGLWIVWLVVYWQGGLAILHDIRAASCPRDRAYLVSLSVVTFGIVLNALALTLRAEPAHPLLSPLGAGLVLLGVMGTFYARRFLGALWTAENTIHAEHPIIDHGPYAIVRHPIYTAAIVLYAGAGLIFPVWWNLILAGTVCIIYILKTAHEDRFLAAQLPGYRAYQQRVPYRLLPHVW